VMYREALRLGLDQDDEIIRRRLIQKMQFLQRDLATVSPPGEKELRAYYDAHPQLFTTATSVSYEQLYFSGDHAGWTNAERRARGVLDQLQQGSTKSLASQDDPFPFQIPAEDLTRAQAVRVFGDTGIVEALFSTSEGEWSEPVRSAYGWHLIKVDHRQSASVAAFSQVRTQVESGYVQEQTEAAQQRELAALRAHYDIVRSDKHDGGS
jgi:peptidyl-prolyl cis-trans isomerase C